MDKGTKIVSPNKLEKYLQKRAEEFTKADIIRFIEENEIEFVNFRYIGGDGRLKTLNFVVNNSEYLNKILTTGERVDGSSLFDFIDADSSDLYVVPKYKTAFVNPFTNQPTVDLMCSFYTSEGKALNSSAYNLVRNANRMLKERTGYELYALGELEYYLFSEIDEIYPIEEQKGYHDSHPFSKWECVRMDAMKAISEIGCDIKYGHAEVGNIIHDDTEMVQQEIEFLPVPAEDAANQVVLAKWAVREVAYKYGLTVSFAPKIIVGHAGSGLHFHTQLRKDGVNAMADENGLTDVAKKLIAGFLKLSPSLSAFGNTVPTSFLRLVPHQEAPTSICWGDKNRSALIRVPLGWIGVDDMVLDANPNEPKESAEKFMNTQTVELRSPDGSANVHALLAAMTVAARYGLESEDSLDVAKELYVDYDIHKSEKKKLDQLPASCFEAAECLEKDKDVYEQFNVFPKGLIDKHIMRLKEHDDKDMSEKLFGNTSALSNLIDKHIHCG